jgi:hypothetical protein
MLPYEIDVSSRRRIISKNIRTSSSRAPLHRGFTAAAIEGWRDRVAFNAAGPAHCWEERSQPARRSRAHLAAAVDGQHRELTDQGSGGPPIPNRMSAGSGQPGRTMF